LALVLLGEVVIMQFINMFFVLDLCYWDTWNKRKNKFHKTNEQKKSVGVTTKQTSEI